MNLSFCNKEQYAIINITCFVNNKWMTIGQGHNVVWSFAVEKTLCMIAVTHKYELIINRFEIDIEFKLTQS